MVLVAVNGLGWDAAHRFGAKTLQAMAADGASAPQGMTPSWPSTAVPNQYTLATGLYPEHHGIVADRFRGEDGRQFDAADPNASADAGWYGGTPLWVLAEKHGLRTACFSWPGCRAAIQGVRPSTVPEDKEISSDTSRVEHAIGSLRLPAASRPRLVLLTLSGVDEAGRGSGPDSAQTRAAVAQIDGLLGRLRSAIREARLPVNLIVAGDRGLVSREGDRIDLSAYVDLSKAVTDGLLLYPASDKEAQTLYSRLKIVDARFMVFRRKDVPKAFHADANPRLGDPVILPVAPAAVRARAPEAGQPDPGPDAGLDGLDPRQFSDMRAAFFAEGPDIRSGIRLKPFENTNVYPFVAAILGLQTSDVDGSVGVLSLALRDGH